ncbi:hypothetical protein [Calderihabitans maritimus]|uniref:Uncharacterized protein n=1 Tax=Calderihabitans maritimus TaxID=1246530 RepID=A0A1Z5HQC0_9FIRM|nr:hypothetical protein [Calderihabitans maritimus]GAW91567.1 hypothetical protein KKC1_07280 [Calderihabitans maritimus]
MHDLWRKTIKSTGALFALPFRVAREALGEKNPTFGEIMAISEDLITIPFKMMERLFTRDNGKAAAEKRWGPRLENIWVNPQVTVLSERVQAAGTDQRQVTFHVSGLICDA